MDSLHRLWVDADKLDQVSLADTARTISKWSLFWWVPFFGMSRYLVWCSGNMQPWDTASIAFLAFGVFFLLWQIFVRVMQRDDERNGMSLALLALASLMLHLAWVWTQVSTFNPLAGGCYANSTVSNTPRTVTYNYLMTAVQNSNNTSPCSVGGPTNFSCDDYNNTMASIILFSIGGFLWIFIPLSGLNIFDLCCYGCGTGTVDSGEDVASYLLLVNVSLFFVSTVIGTASIIRAFPDYSVLTRTDILRADFSMFILMISVPVVAMVWALSLNVKCFDYKQMKDNVSTTFMR